MLGCALCLHGLVDLPGILDSQSLQIQFHVERCAPKGQHRFRVHLQFSKRPLRVGCAGRPRRDLNDFARDLLGLV